MKCEICGRETSENAYCRLHAGAYQQIVKKYDRWKEALEISWKEYLSEIAKNPLTGKWATEVAEQLIKLGKE